jgi:hypothetical protein
MMNGVLVTEGIDAVSIPAVRAAEFNSRMVDFYTSRDATDSMKQPSHEAHSTTRVDPGPAADLEAMPTSKQPTRAFSLEETSREARDNWRRNYYD